jgi:sugar phosphate isomerase/epimerase
MNSPGGKKGTVPICAKHPSGRSGKWGLSPFSLGYNTNGLAHHDLLDAVELLARIGYRSVAVTIDHGALSPRDAVWRQQLAALRRRLDELGMRSVIETGARFLLDPAAKHEPTLVTADPAARARRLEFYRHAVRCAAELQSDCVSLWSGVVDDAAPQEAVMSRLVDGLEQVLEYGKQHQVTIGLEPEPGMFIDRLARFDELLGRLRGPGLMLTLDVGHAHCQGETPIAEQIDRWAGRLVNVHVEDMRSGVHEHLMFGEGQIDFLPVLAALVRSGYQGGLHVELSRHSHDAPRAARQAYAFLAPLLAARP